MNKISDCCKQMNPCKAVCLLQNVMVDLVSGNYVTNYRVGGESFAFAKPSVAEVRGLLAYFEQECNKAKGKPSRQRAKICFVHGDPTCGGCSQQKNRCRC